MNTDAVAGAGSESEADLEVTPSRSLRSRTTRSNTIQHLKSYVLLRPSISTSRLGNLAEWELSEILRACSEPTPWPWDLGWQEQAPMKNLRKSAIALRRLEEQGEGAASSDTIGTTNLQAQSSSTKNLKKIYQSASILMYLLAACIFFTRAYFLGRSRYGSYLSCFWQACFAFLYLLVGVVLPFLALFLYSSGPVRCILDYRQFYQDEVLSREDDVPSNLRIFVTAADVVGPFSSAIGLVTPVMALIDLLAMRSKGDETFNGDFHRSFLLTCCSTVGLVGMVLFGDVYNEVVYDGSLSAIRVLIFHMEQVNIKARDAWRDIAEQHKILTFVLTRLWGIHCFGGLWLARVCLLFGGSIVLAAYSIHEQTAYSLSCKVLSLVLAVCGVILLLRLARLTELCTRTFLVNDSDYQKTILSTALQFAGTFEENQQYSDFLKYLHFNPLQIRMLGMPIKYSVVVGIASRFILQMPIVVAILATLLHSRLHEHVT